MKITPQQVVCSAAYLWACSKMKSILYNHSAFVCPRFRPETNRLRLLYFCLRICIY